jgi:pimeloyl-ACP methyl ester carboxylesterase
MLALFAALAFAGQDLTLKAEDGSSVAAVATPGKPGQGGVVFVHMLGRTNEDWHFLAEKVSKSNMAVISPDLRGHGRNVPAGTEVVLAEADYLAMENDVRAAIAWLRSQGVSQVSCAGADIGANLCLQVAAKDPNIVNLVLLSPGLNYKGVRSADALDRYGDRPVLFVASSEDSYSAMSAEKLDERAKGQHMLAILDKAGHGTKMLNRDPELEGLLVSWLIGSYKLASGEMVRPRPESGSTQGVQTSGEKLDMHK